MVCFRVGIAYALMAASLAHAGPLEELRKQVLSDLEYRQIELMDEVESPDQKNLRKLIEILNFSVEMPPLGERLRADNLPAEFSHFDQGLLRDVILEIESEGGAVHSS